MINPKDLYTFSTILPLEWSTTTKDKDGKKATTTTTLGKTIISYEIRRYTNLRNLSGSLADTFAYQILCTQRIILPNATTYTPGKAKGLIDTYANYPAVLINNIKFKAPPQEKPNDRSKGKHNDRPQVTSNDLSLEIVSYSPRTLNSAVTTSNTSSSGASNSATMQHQSGSSTSQSNSYNASVSVGFFGLDPTAGLTLGFDRGSGSERSSSVSAGGETGSDRQNAGSESMTVKDWACFTHIDTDLSLTWVWGQEYPWNVIQYRPDMNDDLPMFIQNLLNDGTQALPPSQLSQFGLDFTMRSVWIVKPPETSASVIINHTMSYCTATHQGGDLKFSASLGAMNTFTYPSPPSPALDLCLYGLDPILNGDAAHIAIVGFEPRQFLIPPVAAANNGQFTDPTPFKILSSGNNLLIQDTTQYNGFTPADAGAGFTPSETALTAAFTPNCTSLTMTLNFKVVDSVNSYRLFMKHWMTIPPVAKVAPDKMGVMLTIVFNKPTDPNPIVIVKYVAELEAEGGEGNFLSILLRDLSYGTVDYHDYLNLGLNQIDITLTPIGGALNGCGYQVRAISIES